MPLITITPPEVEPVDVDEVKVAARLDASSFDDQLADLLIPAMRAEAEHRLGRRIITQTVELVCDAFPASAIDLLLPGVQAIASIKYLDSAEAEQTVSSADYTLDSASAPCRVLLNSDKSWPGTAAVPNAVRVRYTVGYGDDASAVPKNVRLWIIALVIRALDNPAGTSAGAAEQASYVDHLLDAERFYRAA